MSSILVTGSSGFLGSAVIPRLRAQGHRVIGLDPLPAASPAYPAVTDDLSDQGRVERLLLAEQVSHIIHAGGVSGAMVMPDRPDRVMAINVGGSLNLIQAAMAAKVKTLVYCSSVSAVGAYFEPTPIGSDYPLRPSDAYGCSKAAVDMILRGLWRRVALDVCSLRFTGIYGPGRKTSSMIDTIVNAAIDRRPARVARQGECPYVYIDDAAAAAVAACFSDRRRELVYFIGYPQQVSVDDLASAAAAHSQPFPLAIDETQRTDPRGPVDIGPAQRDFDFRPSIDHRDGIRRMIEARRVGQQTGRD